MPADSSNIPETSCNLVGLNTQTPGRRNEAWDRFYRIYSPVIFRFARHSGLRDADAEEVVAIVMRNLMVAFDGDLKIDREKGRFRYYLRVVINRVIRDVKMHRPTAPIPLSELPEPPAGESTDAELDAIEAQELIRVSLDRLRKSTRVSERDMEIFERVGLRGESPESVADAMGIRVDRVYSIKHEMLARLKKMVTQLKHILHGDD